MFVPVFALLNVATCLTSSVQFVDIPKRVRAIHVFDPQLPLSHLIYTHLSARLPQKSTLRKNTTPNEPVRERGLARHSVCDILLRVTSKCVFRNARRGSCHSCVVAHPPGCPCQDRSTIIPRASSAERYAPGLRLLPLPPIVPRFAHLSFRSPREHLRRCQDLSAPFPINLQHRRAQAGPS